MVQFQHQTSGRKGKGVCLIISLDWDNAALQMLANELEKRCGTSQRAVKEGIIEIQGDKRKLVGG